MNKIDMIKTGVGITTGLGSSMIIGSIARNNCPRRNILEKTVVFAGALGISSLVNYHLRAHTDKAVDTVAQLIENYNKNKK
jgi:hypothetical protein